MYKDRVKTDRWHEGVIVFPDGAVVIRLRSPFRSIDEAIDPVYLSRADTESGISPLHCCFPSKYLKVYFLGEDARPQLITLSQSALSEDVTVIAEYINEAKSKASLAVSAI